jgi:DNA (cytosine-5)-methyltransferase 1
MNELALFAGAGGGILGGHLLGWRTVCAVEWEQYPASVLCARQNDGLLPPFPIWDDVQTFDGNPWRGIVDVVSGGFPCQDISAAGGGAGIDGERSGMWREMARIICEVRPRFVFVENSPMLTSRGLGRVLGDLATMGFDARWGVLGAADVGAVHQRDRIWIVAKQVGNAYNNGQIASQICSSITQGSDTNSARQKQTRKSQGSSEQYEELADTCEIGLFSQEAKQGMAGKFRFAECGMDRKWWEREPDNASRTIERNMGGVVDGVASRVDRLKAIGNGQVPLCAATAWRILSESL